MSDKIIDTLFEKIASKRDKAAQLKSKFKNWTTNRNLRVRGEAPKNIGVMTKEEVLSALAALIGEQRDFKQACELVGETGIVDQIKDGFPLSDWMADLQYRYASIEASAITNEASSLEAQLLKLVSPERLRELELNRLAEAVDKL